MIQYNNDSVESANGVYGQNGSVLAANNLENFNVFSSGIVMDGGIEQSLAAIKDKAKNVLESKNLADEIKILVLDKTVITDLAYSSLVYYKQEDGLVKYFIALIAGSGRQALTANEMYKIALQAKTDRNEVAELYVYGDAIDSVLHSIIREQLVKEDKKLSEYGEPRFLSVAGVVIPYKIRPLDVIEQVTVAAANAFVTSKFLSEGVGLSVSNLIKLSQDNPGKQFKYSINTEPQGVTYDRLGNPIKTDFVANIDFRTSENRGILSVNTKAQDRRLVSVSGYVTGLPIYVQQQGLDQYGNPLPVFRIAPHIVITNIRTYVPDLSSVVLGVIAGSLVANNKQYIKVVMDTMKKDVNPGLFNLLTRLVTDPTTGQAGVVNLFGSSKAAFTPQDKAIMLDRIFDHTPVVSIDIPGFSEAYNLMSTFAWARESSVARADIVKAANILTNNKFGEWNKDLVFSKTVVPGGYYNTKDQQRDIRDFELETVLHRSGLDDETAVNLYLASIQKDVATCYDMKLELLAHYAPDAVVDSKVTRIMLSPEFITTLHNAAFSSGLVTQMDAPFTMPNSGFRADYLSSYNNYHLDVNNTGLVVNANPHNNSGLVFDFYGNNNPWGN